MTNLESKPKLTTPSVGVAVIRTRELAEELKNAIAEELEPLPDHAYGVLEAKEQIRHLEQWLDAGELDPATEVGHWLTNSRSYLGKDYGVE